MSKIVIDTSEVSLDRQIDRALAMYGFASNASNARFAMEALTAGRFSSDPLPAIAPPPWPHRVLEVVRVDGEFFVSVQSERDWTSYRGPFANSPKAAIEVWNSVFSK